VLWNLRQQSGLRNSVSHKILSKFAFLVVSWQDKFSVRASCSDLKGCFYRAEIVSQTNPRQIKILDARSLPVRIALGLSVAALLAFGWLAVRWQIGNMLAELTSPFDAGAKNTLKPLLISHRAIRRHGGFSSTRKTWQKSGFKSESRANR
jgi:hypothetical protein